VIGDAVELAIKAIHVIDIETLNACFKAGECRFTKEQYSECGTILGVPMTERKDI